MRDIIRQVLKEETNRKRISIANKFTKQWLSRYNNLKKYESGDGYYIYLANSNGSILVQLNTQINETAVSEMIWSILEKYYTEKEAQRKIIGWLLDQYQLPNMGYVYKVNQNVLGKIQSGDKLIDNSTINESEEKNPLKNFWFKKWSKQKEKGENPSIYNIEKLGFSKKRNEIIQYFLEFMGYDDENSRSKAVKQYLLNHTFTEKEITEMDNFDQGKIQVRFNKVQFSESDMYQYGKVLLDLDVDFVVLSGSFYNSEEGETYNFSSGDNPFDEFTTYWDFKEEIKQVVESFVIKNLESFGYDINKDFDYIDVKW